MDFIAHIMEDASAILAECQREAGYDPTEPDDEAFKRYVEKLEGLAGALAVQRMDRSRCVMARVPDITVRIRLVREPAAHERLPKLGDALRD